MSRKRTLRPLENVRVIDLTRATAGPYTARCLGDLGAEIIKIETSETADVGMSTRQKMDPDMLFHGDDINFLSLNRNKKSIVLDIKSPKGREVFDDLVKKSDVVLDNMRPRALRKMKMDFDDLKKINPRIISCSVSGYGSTGPDQDKPAFDLILQATSGAISLMDTRDATGRFRHPGINVGDIVGAIWAAYGVAAAVYAREKTGVGQKVDVALQDGLIATYFFSPYYILNFGVDRDPPRFVPWGFCRTKDENIGLCIHREGFWKNFCVAIHHEDWLTDPRFDSHSKRIKNKPELWDLIESILSTKTADEWLKILEAGDVPCAKVKSVPEVLKDPQVLERKMVVDIDHWSGEKFRSIGNPVKMSDNPEIFTTPPALGQHTQEVLSGILGYSDEQIDSLEKQGVVQRLKSK